MTHFELNRALRKRYVNSQKVKKKRNELCAVVDNSNFKLNSLETTTLWSSFLHNAVQLARFLRPGRVLRVGSQERAEQRERPAVPAILLSSSRNHGPDE